MVEKKTEKKREQEKAVYWTVRKKNYEESEHTQEILSNFCTTQIYTEFKRRYIIGLYFRWWGLNL